MMLKYGKKLTNKTLVYLYPSILNGYGDLFKSKIESSVFILAVGIGDNILESNPSFNFLERRPFFILIDKSLRKSKSEEFISWIRRQNFYITDYSFDSIGRTQMLCLEVPESSQNAYDKFIVGLYSEMYTQKELETYFKDNQEVYDVLTKNITLLPKFVDKLEETFQTSNLKYTDFLNSELELPYKVNIEEEVFNYKK